MCAHMSPPVLFARSTLVLLQGGRLRCQRGAPVSPAPRVLRKLAFVFWIFKTRTHQIMLRRQQENVYSQLSAASVLSE